MRKIFSILTFGILFLPMVRTDFVLEMNESRNVPDGGEIVISSSGEKHILFLNVMLSGYDLAKRSVLGIFEMLNDDNEMNFFSASLFFLFPFFSFLFLFISVLLIILSVIKNYDKTFLTLSIINLVIVIINFSIVIIEVDDVNKDIKYGFYLLVLNSIMIVVAGILHKKNKPVNFANLVNLVKK